MNQHGENSSDPACVALTGNPNCGKTVLFNALAGLRAKVELVRFTPMGDPVEIKARGYNLTLRKSEAEQILAKAN